MSRLFAGEELIGEVVGVYYADTSSGFGVVELKTGGDGARCSGPLADLVEGQAVRLVGDWTDHPRYGRTFEAAFYEQIVPRTEAGLKAFLLSERFPGVGEKTADRILTAFGSQAGWVIEREPARLTAEAGVTTTLADRIHERWMQGLALADLVHLLEPVGVPHDVVRAILSRFGAEAAEVARADPYALLEVDRCRFAHADGLALHLGVDALDDRRLRAGARAAHRSARRRDGHQYLTPRQVTEEAARLLGVDPTAARAGLDGALVRGELVLDVVDLLGEERREAVYTPAGLASEQGLAEDVARLLGSTRSLLRSHRESVSPSDELTAGQADAVRLVFESPLAVLTGGPGTGK
ncbi:MAG: helix-hairpin-helix domain-containing protein, partial [Nitriliruptorales bacterium]